jgi:methionyl aminopeptidase
MSIETTDDLSGISKAGQAVAITLKKMQEYARPGMSTKELDEYGHTVLQSFGAKSAPKKDYDFPGYTCISLNDEVCHGIPSADRILKEGDLVNIDVSAELDGYYGDNGGSFILGEDHQNLQPLVEASKEILNIAMKHIKSSVRISDVGGIIEREAKKRGFKVIRNLCGHGTGRKLHEAPDEIPNYKDRLNKSRFRKNSVIALETFISTNTKWAYEMPDGWTYTTKNKGFVAQHEHTIIVTDGDPIVVTKENGI